MTYQEAQQEVRRMAEYREKRYGRPDDKPEAQKAEEQTKPAKYYSR